MTGGERSGTYKLISGNEAAAYGAKLARAEVISAYPITPQTTIVEKIAEFVASGQMAARYVPVESEHSVLAVLLGAASVGARCFTATSSQGLALMHELVHWAGRGRLPMVMVNCNRALAPPWNLGAEQNDSLAQRDTGWIQFYCESNQEVLDTVLQAFRVAEQVSLPVMLSLDGFFLSHTSEPVLIPSQEWVDVFLPKKERKYRLDPENPLAFGWDVPMSRLRRELQEAMVLSRRTVQEAGEEFQKIFGRSYPVVDCYRTDGAQVVLVTSSTMTTTGRLVVNQLRERGFRVGVVKIRMFRPFPKEEIAAALQGADKVAVMDRNCSYGNAGIFATEVKACLYGQERKPKIFDFVTGLAGTDVTPEIMTGIFEYVFHHEEENAEPIWM